VKKYFIWGIAIGLLLVLLRILPYFFGGSIFANQISFGLWFFIGMLTSPIQSFENLFFHGLDHIFFDRITTVYYYLQFIWWVDLLWRFCFGFLLGLFVRAVLALISPKYR